MTRLVTFAMSHHQTLWICGGKSSVVGRSVFRQCVAQPALSRDAGRVLSRFMVSRGGDGGSTAAVTAERSSTSIGVEAEARRPPAVEAMQAAGERASRQSHSSLPAIYLELGKAKLSGLVTMTTAAGFALAVPATAPVGLKMLALTCTGTGMAAMSASAFNQIMEVPNDSRMARTAKRPLVTGKISQLHASAFAASCGVGGVALLATHVNPLTGALAAANIALYTLVYTPLKQRSVWNTWVGAVVGAIPPVMGWTAVTGSIDGGALLLGGLLFSWQMPHFLSLAYMMRKDYLAGGYRMMPQEVGSQATARASAAMIRHCVYLQAMCMGAPYLGVCIGAPYLGLVDPLFVWEATALNGAFLYMSLRFHRAGQGTSGGAANSAARKVFLCSLLYLPLLLGCMVLHRALPGPAEEVEEATKGCPFLDASKMVAEQEQQPQAAAGGVMASVRE